MPSSDWNRITVPKELRVAVLYLAEHKEYGFVNKADVVRQALRSLLIDIGYYKRVEKK